MPGFIRYRSYSFVDKDPAIDKMRTLIADAGLSYRKVHEESDVSVSTIYNWFHGKTRRPSHAALAAVASALGYNYELVKKRGATVVKLEARRKRA